MGPHSPTRSLASKAGRPGWESRDWVIIHDTSFNMNQQAGPQFKGQRQKASVLGRHPRTHSLPHTFPSPKQHLYSISHFTAFGLPFTAFSSVSQASCYSFLYWKRDGVLVVSFYPLLRSFLHRPCLTLCFLEKWGMLSFHANRV